MLCPVDWPFWSKASKRGIWMKAIAQIWSLTNTQTLLLFSINTARSINTTLRVSYVGCEIFNTQPSP